LESKSASFQAIFRPLVPKLISVILGTFTLAALLIASAPASSAPPAASTCPPGMKSIPGGSYTVFGSNEHATVQPFCLDTTEVTVEAFSACVAAKGCATPSATGNPPSKFDQFCNYHHPENRGKHPINCVDWAQAQAYCAFAGKRLPTQYEWNWAAQGGSKGNSYPWGKQRPTATLANGCGPECFANLTKKLGMKPNEAQRPLYPDNDGWPETAPVGSFKAGENPFGLLDMAGNVSEWNATQEKGPKDVRYGICGGSWIDESPENLYSFRANSLPRDGRMPIVGFRCAK